METKTTAFVDAGGRNTKLQYLLTGDDQVRTVEHEDFLVSLIPGADIVVIEDSHLKQRLNPLEASAKGVSSSQAQIYTIQQMRQLQQTAERLGVQIKLTPQIKTPRMRSMLEKSVEAVGFDLQPFGRAKKFDLTTKSEAADVAAMRYYYERFPQDLEQLKTFVAESREEYQQRTQPLHDAKNQLTKDINNCKTAEWDPAEIPALTDLLEIRSRLLEKFPEDHPALQIADLTIKKRSGDLVNPQQLGHILLTLRNLDGSLRLRTDNNKLPYWKYAKQNYFALKPFHFRAGCVAGYYKKFMRPDLTRGEKLSTGNAYDEHAEVKAVRATKDAALRDLWRALREIVLEVAAQQ